MFMVMSATTMDGRSPNRARCFETNVLNIASEAEAERIATERTKAEIAAGHPNVEWYPCPMMPSLDGMRAMMSGKL